MKRRRGFIPLRAAWAIPAFAVLTLVLGAWGWMDHGQDFPDSLYRAAAMFSYNDLYGGGVSTIDWRLKVGRWFGLAVVFSAAFAALGAVLQERVALTAARWLKQDVVVIGGARTASAAFDAAQEAGKSVLWLGAPALGSTTLSALALPWPPESNAKTVFEHCGDAEHILVAPEDDASAVALARAARRSAPTAYITVLMREARLAEDAASTLNEARTRVLPQAAISARSLNIDHPPFLLAQHFGHRRVHALIIGFGQVGQAIARDLIINCRTSYLEKPHITVIDPRAKALGGVLRVRAPDLEETAEFLFIEGEIGAGAISPDPAMIGRAMAEAGPITAAYICLASDVAALSTAGLLQSLLRTVEFGAAPIFVRLRDANTLAKQGGDLRGLDALTPFGDLDSILEACEFLSTAPDAAARAFNEAYRASLTPEVRDDPANRSAFPWDRLDETYRQADRDVVTHIPAKLASAGIDPVYWRGVGGVPHPGHERLLFSNDAELEVLSELEHERWNSQRRMDGWRWDDIPKKDEHKRIHPSLVPYEQLADDVKEWDRVKVRQTQTACWGPDAGKA